METDPDWRISGSSKLEVNLSANYWRRMQQQHM
jgi:hypothetical protein